MQVLEKSALMANFMIVQELQKTLLINEQDCATSNLKNHWKEETVRKPLGYCAMQKEKNLN